MPSRVPLPTLGVACSDALRHEDVGFRSPVTWRNVLIAPFTGVLCDVGVSSNRKKPQRVQ